jgi:hypothetical protein
LLLLAWAFLVLFRAFWLLYIGLKKLIASNDRKKTIRKSATNFV